MRLKSMRSKEVLSEVLLEPEASGPETAYWVFEGISKEKWNNMTIVTSGRYGREFPKTYGHYHTSEQFYESSKLITGTGIFVLQEKFYDVSGKWIPNRVEAVYFVQAQEGDEMVYIPTEFAHSWSNVGLFPLVTYDDWVETGQPSHNYNDIKDLRGMAYYLIADENGQVKPVPNPNYDNLPQPKWVTPEEFNYLTRK